ncbi:hypothetical protein B0H11DRAFT_2330486 [Mycena galericulata]|nr:hypothetical protein B0H11DRAFT_2330486 [Mycena galericulata]
MAEPGADDYDQRDSSLERELEEYELGRQRDDPTEELDAWDESAYNDGNGIKYGIYFQPLLPPTPAGGKPPRKNARAEMINTNTFVHENSDFATTLDALIEALHYGPPLKFKIVGGNLRTTAFSVLYTIPQGDKEMRLETEKHYKTMLNDTKGKVRLDITELPTNQPTTGTQRGRDEEEEADPLGQNSGTEAQSDDVDDIAMLAARRRSASAKPASTSSVTINNDFAGLAAIFQPFLTGAASASASHSQPQAPRSPSRPAPLPSTSASPLKPTRLTIAEFCTAFDLGPDILDQLTPMKLAGPHVLEFVENEILDKYLEIGQRVSVRYAEAQWKKGKAGF